MAKRKKKGTGKRAPRKPTQKSVRQRLAERKLAGGRAAALKKKITDEKSVRAKLHEMKENRGRKFSVAKKPRRKPQQKRATGDVSATSAVSPVDSTPKQEEIANEDASREIKSASEDEVPQPDDEDAPQQCDEAELSSETSEPPEKSERDTVIKEPGEEKDDTPAELSKEMEAEAPPSEGVDSGEDSVAMGSDTKIEAKADEDEKSDDAEEAPPEDERIEETPEIDEEVISAEDGEPEPAGEIEALKETGSPEEGEEPEKLLSDAESGEEPSEENVDGPRETVTIEDVVNLVDSSAVKKEAERERSSEPIQEEAVAKASDDIEERDDATTRPEEKIRPDDSEECDAPSIRQEEPPSAVEIPAKPPESQKEKKTVSPVRFFTPVKLLIVAAALLLFGAVGYLLNRPPEIVSVTAAEEYNEDFTVTITVEVKNASFNQYFDSWCMLKSDESIPNADDDGWVLADNGVCKFDVSGGNFYIFAKDSLGNISEMKSQDIEINDILAVEIPRQETYLPHGGTQQLEAEIVAIGVVDEGIEWSSSDDAVATVSSDGIVTGHSNGTVSVTATTSNGLSASTEVVVTDCIVLSTNEYKQFIPAYYYSEEEAALMDQILFSRVADAGGYGTRGAVVAAARFITLEMPYMIPYFYENGRMDAHPGRPVADGEGRYYHVGLYFSETKFDDIVVSSAGPAIWGAPLMNFQEEGYFKRGQRYPNGLSCSGFVSWAMINGGIDTGDIGAGDYPQYDNEFSDIGERVPLTVDLIKSGGVKVGDLIGKDGHIAIVVGLDDTHIWIAESYFRGVQTVKFTIDRGVIDCDEYHYIINMDHMYYNGEGVYSDTWE